MPRPRLLREPSRSLACRRIVAGHQIFAGPFRDWAAATVNETLMVGNSRRLCGAERTLESVGRAPARSSLGSRQPIFEEVAAAAILDLHDP